MAVAHSLLGLGSNVVFLVLGVGLGGMVGTGLNRGVLSCSSVLAWGSFECPESAAVHVLCLISCLPSAGFDLVPIPARCYLQWRLILDS